VSAIVIEFERLKKDNQELNKALELACIGGLVLAKASTNSNDEITPEILEETILMYLTMAKEELASVEEN